MNKAMIVFLFVGVSVAFGQMGTPARVVFIVRNEEGQAVTNAMVVGCFTDLSPSGGRDRFTGRTDTGGMYRAKGVAIPGVYARFTCPGHYETIIETNRPVIARADGKGYEVPARWDVQIPILLKRIRNAIPMYARPVRGSAFNPFERVGVYCLGRTSSYDFVIGAYLPPNGTGKIEDVRFTWSMSIYATNQIGRALEYDTLSRIELPNGADGICRGEPDGKTTGGGTGSQYISAYEAPLDGYTNVITIYERIRGRKAESNDDGHYLYYFRIRTQTNDLGQVTNALYGKIYGQINGNFTYYLNPTPNDRNIEFDPNRNLFIFSERERIGYLP